jgi:hypothetical protein
MKMFAKEVLSWQISPHLGLSGIAGPAAATNAWVNGMIGEDEFRYLLRAFEGESFTDSRRQPDLARAIELPVQQPGVGRHIGDFDLWHASQDIGMSRGRKQYAGNEIVDVEELQCVLPSDPGMIIEIRKDRASIVLRGASTKCASVSYSELYVFATSLSVSQNGLFVLVDLSLGLSRVFLVRCAAKETPELLPMSDFRSSSRPMSVISGYFMAAATASGPTVTVWEAVTGRACHTVELDSDVTQLAVDEESGIWVSTDSALTYFSINGDWKSTVTIPERVTCLTALQLKGSVEMRSAAAGTESGALYLLSPRQQDGIIKWKRLPSPHKVGIRSVIVNPSLQEFVSIDIGGYAFVWCGIGAVLTPTPEQKTFSRVCAMCGEADRILEGCSSCHRSLCQRCASWDEDGHIFCGLCEFRYSSCFF